MNASERIARVPGAASPLLMSPNPQCHGDPTCRLSKPENRLDP